VIYLDANFFILCNFDSGSRGNSAREIQRKISEGLKASTSVLALDEVMWVLIRNRKKEVLRETIEDIFALPNLSILDVAGPTALDALDHIENEDLKPRDAFHVAIMKSNKVNEIVSDDRDFDRVSGIKRTKL
jgi:uncharacterized protein